MTAHRQLPVRSLTAIKATLAIFVLMLAILGAGAVKLFSVQTTSTPFGASVLAGENLATLLRTQEPYLPKLHRNPDRDRFRIDLLLTPLADDTTPRRIRLANGLQREAFHPGTRFLGTDGPLLWMLVPELKALDLRTSKILSLQQLRDANPGMDDFWHTARFHFTDRLHLMSPDRQRVYTLDPETLHARRLDEAPRIAWQDPTPSLRPALCLGGPILQNDWVVALSPKERDDSFRVGSTIASALPAPTTREPRGLYRMRVEPIASRQRILALEAISAAEYTRGTIIRQAPEKGPLALPAPTRILVVHETGSVLDPRVNVTCAGLEGSVAWTANTGLRELDQVLPDTTRLVLIGTLPAPAGKVPEPVAIVLDNSNGALTTRPLRP